MSKLTLIATATFGLEAVVRREVETLGYPVLSTEDGKVTYRGNEEAIVKSNLWLRSADRVLLKIGEFLSFTFEELYQQTKALPWEEWIPLDGKFTVTGSSVKSQLSSVPACQSIVKKAVVDKLKETYPVEVFPETGALYTIKATLLKDRVTLTIDTTGAGLHKRGYRKEDVSAPIKETLAAALVSLSFWNKDRILLDPFCGSGTILIEAAMIAKNIAPGLNRNFVCEEWAGMDSSLFEKQRKEAREKIENHELKIFGSDIDKRAVAAAKENAAAAGVVNDIMLSVNPVSSIKTDKQSGIIITNPPYGERIGEKKHLPKIYKTLSSFIKKNPTWSLFLITSDKEFEKMFRDEPANRRRKLYNGRIETCYYQYHGEKKR